MMIFQVNVGQVTTSSSDMDKIPVNHYDVTKPPDHGEPTDLLQIKQLLKHIVDSMKDKARSGHIADEWKALAMILDRIFFWMTTITSIIMIPTFLLQTDPSEH